MNSLTSSVIAEGLKPDGGTEVLRVVSRGGVLGPAGEPKRTEGEGSDGTNAGTTWLEQVVGNRGTDGRPDVPLRVSMNSRGEVTRSPAEGPQRPG